MDVEIRPLGPGDEAVVVALAPAESRPSLEHAARLLALEDTHYLVAFERAEPVGFLFAYELVRRHREPVSLLVYDIEVAESHRRRGVASALFAELRQLARDRGITAAWVLTDADDEPALALYAAQGGVRSNAVMFDFEL